VIQKLSKFKEFDYLLNKTFEDYLSEFLNSNDYQTLLEKQKIIQEKKHGNGDYYMKCFHFVALVYAPYFNEDTAFRKKIEAELSKF